MSKQQTLDKHWLNYLEWSMNMYQNQVGYGKVDGLPISRAFFEAPTEANFWRWYMREIHGNTTGEKS